MKKRHSSIFYLSLGSNMGNPAGNLEKALHFLEERGIRLVKRSSLYRTEPQDIKDQPSFYNIAVKVRTIFDPFELLEETRDIECLMGRNTKEGKGPRIIDIDLLFAGGRIIQSETMIIPHPRLHMRNFVLVPLSEIAPGLVHPVLKKTISRLCQEGGGRGEVFRLETATSFSGRNLRSITYSCKEISSS